MRILLYVFCFFPITSNFFVKAQNVIGDYSFDNREPDWIKEVIDAQDKPIKSKDFIFYCTGHHGINWSLIALDSSGISLYNGTTRKLIEYSNPCLEDTLSFVRDNFESLSWGFDSLAYSNQFVIERTTDVYSPIYNQLYLIKDNELTFSYNDNSNYYIGADSIKFHHNLSRLEYLLFWLAAPSARPYMPIPNDTLL